MWKRVNSFGLNIVRMQDTLEEVQPVLDLGTEVTSEPCMKGGSAGGMNRWVHQNSNLKGECSSLLLLLLFLKS